MSGRELYIGLMSGTSLDGVDGVLADLAQAQPQVLAFSHTDFPPALRAELMALQSPVPDELHRAQLAGVGLADVYAQTVDALLTASGIPATQVIAAGAHGQTVRHRPEHGYTLQLLAPARLAEQTGIAVAADFRSRDIAAGGQGAPLVPAFHRAVFAHPDIARVVVNVGGIANLSVLRPGEPVHGFDCGPGNVLMDGWIARHGGAAFDQDGRWAATGQVHAALLQQLLNEPYLSLPPPKSTGRDLFNADWLDRQLATCPGVAPADVQATLLEFTARSIAQAVRPQLGEGGELYLCGGGARNTALVDRLGQLIPGRSIAATDALGVPVDQVEALAFAWLACCAVRGEPGNLPTVTGAAGPRILGAIYPA
jgi:anhydro-N-acetylmuramic acid kinase